MFSQFPKKRPPLPKAYQEIHEKYYSVNREGRSPATKLGKFVEGWLHLKVAADQTAGQLQSTLEIGAGNLNHLRYEKNTPYDIVEPRSHLYENSVSRSQIRNCFSDISEIPQDYKYQRIIAIASFEHISDLPEVVRKSAALLLPRGNLRVAIPNHGSKAWTLAWKISTGLEFRLKYKLNYSIIMQHEHLNTATEVEAVLRHFFSNVNCKFLGLTKKFSLYHFYDCSTPIIPGY